MTNLNHIFELSDDCLKQEVQKAKLFSLKTNLAELGGPGVYLLSESLMHFSMRMANKRIIELIMYENQYIFNTPASIRKIMDKDSPVMDTFILLGKHDVNCNLEWLISSLYRLSELVPLKDILSRAPPYIIKLIPNERNTILPGEFIQFEVRTVSKAEITWWKSNGDDMQTLGETLRMEPCSIKTVTYNTKPADQGWYFIVVTSLGIYHEKSERIYVGQVETEQYGKAYAEMNYSKDTIKRVALLIGIMEYRSCSELSAPKDDIAELDPILREIGFTVYSFADLNMKQFLHVLHTFGNDVIEKDTYVFFYFAGHGCSEEKRDYVLFTGFSEKMQISEILNILLKNEPKPLLTIFDTCRNDISNKTKEDMKMAEAYLPIRDGMMLVMSTFPQEKAYEKQKRYESHSQIIKPLCNCLLNYACKTGINMVFSKFVNDPSIFGQSPAIYSGPMPYILGKKDFLIPSFKPRVKWISGEIALDFGFDVFHNILIIWLDQKTKDYFKYYPDRQQ